MALAYYYSSKVPSIMYTLIDLDSVGLYLFLANLIISLLYLVWSSSYTILYKDQGSDLLCLWLKLTHTPLMFR